MKALLGLVAGVVLSALALVLFLDRGGAFVQVAPGYQNRVATGAPANTGRTGSSGVTGAIGTGATRGVGVNGGSPSTIGSNSPPPSTVGDNTAPSGFTENSHHGFTGPLSGGGQRMTIVGHVAILWPW